MYKKEYYQNNKKNWKQYRENKMKKYPLYTVWHGILVRVGVRPNAKDHEIRDYINQGISVCKEWLSYENFHSWAMSNGYQKGLAIDRIDVNKGYGPENCRFVTVIGAAPSGSPTSTNVFITTPLSAEMPGGSS